MNPFPIPHHWYESIPHTTYFKLLQPAEPVLQPLAYLLYSLCNSLRIKIDLAANAPDSVNASHQHKHPQHVSRNRTADLSGGKPTSDLGSKPLFRRTRRSPRSVTRHQQGAIAPFLTHH